MNNTYACLSKSQFFLNNFELRPISSDDLERIRIWRNSQKLYLRQNVDIEYEDQLNYFQAEILPEFIEKKPKNILFSYLLNGELIGYGGLVHISWSDQRAELSFLLSPNAIDNKLDYKSKFQNFLKMIKNIAFYELKLNRIFTETFNIRDFHISVLEQSGFEFEGRLKQHIKINDVYVDSLIHGCLNDLT